MFGVSALVDGLVELSSLRLGFVDDGIAAVLG